MIITIARQCGCGAVRVGMLLKDYFGIPLYTRQSLRSMAEEQGILPQLDDFFEERPVDDIRFAISADYADANIHLHNKTCKLISGLIGDRDCIIIGRCGNYLFRNRKDLVSVFLKGDASERIKSVMEATGLSNAKARALMEHTDDCRANYHRYYTGLRWGDASDYDICIDNCRIAHAQTARLIADYVGALGVK